MSKPEDQMRQVLAEEYPRAIIKEQYYVSYQGRNLRLDFFVLDYHIGIEVDGVQHENYVPHFHKSRRLYADARARDSLKEQWAEDNQIVLIRFSHNERITRENLRSKIAQAVSNGEETS